MVIKRAPSSAWPDIGPAKATRIGSGSAPTAVGAAAARVGVMGIGVQKSATSWVFRNMTTHPDVRGAVGERREKEINFFNHHYEYGYDWYEQRFRPGPWANTEFSVLYFHDRNVPERLNRYNPRARLILCLRNPVDRSLSQYRHEIRFGRAPHRLDGFWDAVKRNPSYLEQGMYATHLERWLEHVPRSRIHVVDYEDVVERPEDVIRGVFRFINVDPDFLPEDPHRRVNTARILGDGPLRKAITGVKEGVRVVAGRRVTRWLAGTPVGRRIQGYRYVEVGGHEGIRFGDEERKRLAQVFAPEMERLSRLLDRDYHRWI